MKPTHTTKSDGTKCTPIRITFWINFEDIIFATAYLLKNGEKPNKSNVREMLRNTLHDEGENYSINGFEGYEIEEKHEEEAEIIAKKYFPEWF